MDKQSFYFKWWMEDHSTTMVIGTVKCLYRGKYHDCSISSLSLLVYHITTHAIFLKIAYSIMTVHAEILSIYVRSEVHAVTRKKKEAVT